MAELATGSATIKSNVAQIIKKLDYKPLVGPSATMLLTKGVQQGAAYLKPLIPVKTGRSRGLVGYKVLATTASILAPSQPLIYLERGSQSHIGPAPRLHRKKSAAAFRSGALRIKGLHFMRKDKAWTVNNLKTNLIPLAAKDIESRFASL